MRINISPKIRFNSAFSVSCLQSFIIFLSFFTVIITFRNFLVQGFLSREIFIKKCLAIFNNLIHVDWIFFQIIYCKKALLSCLQVCLTQIIFREIKLFFIFYEFLIKFILFLKLSKLKISLRITLNIYKILNKILHSMRSFN